MAYTKCILRTAELASSYHRKNCLLKFIILYSLQQLKAKGRLVDFITISVEEKEGKTCSIKSWYYYSTRLVLLRKTKN